MSTNKKKSGKKPATGVAGNTPRHDQRYNQGDLPKDKPTTLKDLLSPEQLAKLTEQSNELKEQEKTAQETKRKAELDRREKEKKELENNFEYLLNNTKMDWKNYK
nr:YqkE family protein [Tumebacillus amylolyticus]